MQTNTFPNPGIMKQKEYPHALQKKAIRKRVTRKVVRDTAGRTQLGLTFRILISSSTIHHTTQ